MKKTIGIIGGMGPAATVDLFNLIVENTNATCDQEHIHILIDCNPSIPDRTSAIINGTRSPLDELYLSAERLARAGADFLIIPCNTSHYYIDQIRDKVSVPIIDMIKETALYARDSGHQKAIILCTDGTRKTGVYTQRFEQQGVKAIYPNEELQSEVNRIIYDGIKGGVGNYDVTKFNDMLKELTDRTGAVPVLGCTELPIAQKRYNMQGNFINPTFVLACSAIRKAGYDIRKM